MFGKKKEKKDPPKKRVSTVTVTRLDDSKFSFELVGEWCIDVRRLAIKLADHHVFPHYLPDGKIEWVPLSQVKHFVIDPGT
jgi:hypothetical protein